MNAARLKQARLERVLAARRAALKAAEARLCAAAGDAIKAQARVGTVQALISTAATPPGETALSALRGAAALRHILRPVLEAATHHAADTVREKSEAAGRLADADARHERSCRDVAAARAAAELETEERESADRPAIRRRR